VKGHVDFLGALFFVWGALTASIGLSMLLLGFGALSIVASPSRAAGVQVAAGLTAATFVTIALVAIVWGLAHIGVAIPLRRRRPAARVVALTLGAVDIVLLPYGTAVGGYALWALLHEQGKGLFTEKRACRE
jgi:hypothetical protein